MSSYYVWIMMLTSSYTSFILGKLVRKGYKVSYLSPNKEQLIVGGKDAPSQMLGLKLETSEAKSVEKVYDDVIDVVNNVKVKHFGVIVITGGASASWIGSNISLSGIQKSKTKKKPLRKPSYLTLIKTPTEPQSDKEETTS